MTEDKEINAVLDRYRTAVYSKDVDAFIGLYDEDARVFDLWGRWLYRGSADWRKTAEEWFGSLGPDRSSPEFHDVHIQLGDRLASVHEKRACECRHWARVSEERVCECRHSR